MIRTTERAAGRWYGILKTLGMDEKHLRNRHGPCPLCGGSDRFRFDDRDGRGTYFCNNCGSGDGIKLAMNYTGMDFKACAAKIDDLCGAIKAEKIKPKVVPINKLKRIGAGLVEITDGDPVSLYLKNRGLKTPVKYLRYHPALPYWDEKTLLGHFPAMIAAFRDVENRVVTYHQTYLTHDGYKANVPSPKKVASAMAKGGAIHLADPCEVMGIAEGIETAIAARILKGVPTWAAVSATALSSFEPPAECKKLIVFGDRDQSFTGQMHAYQLAHRLRDRVEVVVELPEQQGDWADVLKVGA